LYFSTVMVNFWLRGIPEPLSEIMVDQPAKMLPVLFVSQYVPPGYTCQSAVPDGSNWAANPAPLVVPYPRFTVPEPMTAKPFSPATTSFLTDIGPVKRFCHTTLPLLSSLTRPRSVFVAVIAPAPKFTLPVKLKAMSKLPIESTSNPRELMDPGTDFTVVAPPPAGDL
jgi:hypothetical protein